MKSCVGLLIVVLGASWLLAAPGAPKSPGRPNATNQFTIKGMHCDGCASGLAAELRLTPGVAKAEVSLTNRLALVAYNTNQVTPQALIKVVREAGYEAELKKP